MDHSQVVVFAYGFPNVNTSASNHHLLVCAKSALPSFRKQKPSLVSSSDRRVNHLEMMKPRLPVASWIAFLVAIASARPYIFLVLYTRWVPLFVNPSMHTVFVDKLCNESNWLVEYLIFLSIGAWALKMFLLECYAKTDYNCGTRHWRIGI